MKIEFETSELTRSEAAGLAALILAICPDLEIPGPAKTVREFVEPGSVFPLTIGAAGGTGGAGGTGANAATPADVFTADPIPGNVFAVAPMPEVMPPEAGVPFVPPADTATAPGGSTPAPILAPAPASATPLAPADVDVNGLPWDARIHTETKAKNKDGSWRQKRKADPAEVASVTAELKAAMAAPAALPPGLTATAPEAAPVPPAPSPSPAPAPAAPPPPPPAAPISSDGAASPLAIAPAVPPAPAATPPVMTPAAPPPPAAPAATVPTTAPPATPAAPASDGSGPTATTGASPSESGPALFARVMLKVAQATNVDKVITMAEVAAIVQGVGLQNLRDLNARPDLIPAFEAQFDALTFAAGAGA